MAFSRPCGLQPWCPAQHAIHSMVPIHHHHLWYLCFWYPCSYDRATQSSVGTHDPHFLPVLSFRELIHCSPSGFPLNHSLWLSVLPSPWSRKNQAKELKKKTLVSTCSRLQYSCCFWGCCFFFFLNRDSANPVILSDCYIYIYLCIKLVSRGYPAKYSNYVNQNVFKHLSLLAIFPLSWSWGWCCWESWVEPCPMGQMLSLFKNKLLEEAQKSSESKGK